LKTSKVTSETRPQLGSLSFTQVGQRFAPAWKKFASEIASWQDLVKVAVVECSDETNTPLCREYRITRYPTVKYFHENYRFGSGALIMSHQNQNYATVEFLKKALIEKLMEEIGEGRGAIYPNLLPYEGADLEQLIESIPKNVQYVFLVVDAADAYLGAEVALDLHKTNGIIVRHSLKNNSVLISKLQIKHFPTIVALDPNRNVQFMTCDANRTALKRTKFLEEKGFKTVRFFLEETKNNTSQVAPRGIGNAIQGVLRQCIKKMGDVIFQVDLEAAVRYSLRQKVSAVQTIKGNQLEALAAYLQVLKKYFPFYYNSSSFIDELLTLTSNSGGYGNHITW
jgi:thiol oxidase